MIRSITEEVTSHFDEYDEHDDFGEFRNLSSILDDKIGNCAEHNLLLGAAFNLAQIPFKWLVTKNPKGFFGSNTKDVSYHPFLVFSSSGGFKQDKSDLYCADAIKGIIMPLKSLHSLARRYFSAREYTAFYLQFSAEYVSLVDRDHEKAINILKIAEKVNPNNYTIPVSIALVHQNIGYYNNHCGDEIDTGDKLFRKAIRMAPRCADVHKTYADFCHDVYETDDLTLKEYQKAARKETRDLQVLNCLANRLEKLGDEKLADKVRERFNEICEKDGYYCD